MEQNEKKPLIILTGPTAVGKTELSIELAKAVNGEILSADSMQVYRGMDIGTAKIKKEEMRGHLCQINTWYESLRWHYPNQVKGRNGITLPLSRFSPAPPCL